MRDDSASSPQLEFHKKLAPGMLENNSDDEGASINYTIRHKKQSRGPSRPGHELASRPNPHRNAEYGE